MNTVLLVLTNSSTLYKRQSICI